MTLAFDHLADAHSALGRFDPRWKLAALTIAAALTASLHTWVPATVALGAALVLAELGRLHLRWLWLRLGTVALFIAPFALWLPFTAGDAESGWRLGPVVIAPQGLELAVVLVAKSLALVTLILVLLATAPLHATFKAAHALHVPGFFVQLAMLTYRYIFVMAEELQRLRIALRVRGYRNRVSLHSYRTIGHVAGTLLVRGDERAERVGQAMRCRGFDGQLRSLTEFRTTRADVGLFLLIVGFAVVLLVGDLMQR